MKLTVNGEEHDVPEGLTIAGLLARLEVRAGRVAVEVNLNVVKRAQFDAHTLAPGDTVEIVAFVGGG